VHDTTAQPVREFTDALRSMSLCAGQHNVPAVGAYEARLVEEYEEQEFMRALEEQRAMDHAVDEYLQDSQRQRVG